VNDEIERLLLVFGFEARTFERELDLLTDRIELYIMNLRVMRDAFNDFEFVPEALREKADNEVVADPHLSGYRELALRFVHGCMD
jgi:hypothetical protein